jgi:hypothetical protein
MEVYIKKMVFLFEKKRWMKDKRWIKDGNRPSGKLPYIKIAITCTSYF